MENNGGNVSEMSCSTRNNPAALLLACPYRHRAGGRTGEQAHVHYTQWPDFGLLSSVRVFLIIQRNRLHYRLTNTRPQVKVVAEKK